MSRSFWIRLVILLLIGAAVVAALAGLPVRDTMSSLLAWVQDLGPLGVVVFIVCYILACVLFLPGSILTLGAGFVFGVVTGTVAVSIGSTLGAVAAFVVGRTVARPWVQRRVESNPRFRAIDEAVARQGFLIVLLLRLSPVFPFNLLNYALGLTRVPLPSYALASWIGMLPGTLMYVYLGSFAHSVAEILSGQVQGGLGQQILFGVGLAATVVVTVVVTRIARQALAQHVAVDKSPQSNDTMEGKQHAAA